MSTITDEIIDKSEQQRDQSFSFLQILFLILSVLLAAMYIGDTLFGKNSLEVLWSLQKEQKILSKNIDHLSHENARLQKKLFELKSLLPESDAKVSNDD